MLTIASVNVNGIRAAYKRGMGTWLEARKPDVVLLQEVRASDEILADHLPAGEWHLAHEASETKGRAGVAIASRLPMTAVRIGLKTGVTGDSGPLGGGRPGAPRARGRSGAEHHRRVHLPALRHGRDAVDGREVRVPRPRHGPAGGHRGAGRVRGRRRGREHRAPRGGHQELEGQPEVRRLPPARARLPRPLVRRPGLARPRPRAGRRGPGPFTWWSWRGKAFDNDAGWRIDYQLATPDLADAAVSATVDRAATYAERFSDHAPVVVEYDL